MREWMARVLAVGRRGRRDAEVDDELRFHAEELAHEFEQRGMDAAAARTAAARELGGIDRTKQAWRDQRTWLPLEEILQDVRYAGRVLWKSRGVSSIAALMLAAGVASATSLFTVVDAVLLAPLPYPDAGRLVVVFEEWLPNHAPNVSVTPGTFLEWQDRARMFDAMTAIDARQQNLTSDGEPEQVRVGAVSRGFGSTARVQPLAGRLFADEEFEPGREHVALIGHALWTDRYGREPIVGRTIVLDDQPYTVIGIMPSGFMFPQPDQQIWVPMPMTAADRANRSGHTLYAVGRVREGVAIAAATNELHDVAATLRREFPDSNGDWDVTVVPARQALVGNTAPVLEAMAAAIVLLLLVACANIAGLLLAHGASRSRELAVRAALGASRLRIARQLLTESVVLALIGAGAGLALAWAAQPAIAALRPPDLVTWKPVAVDTRALALAGLLALACGAVFGMLPAIAASQASLASAASERASGRRTSRLRQALVMFEIALAVVLVCGAALFGRTLERLTAVDPGFRADGVVTMTLALPSTRYGSDARVDAFYRALLDRVRSLPGVKSAGAVHALPLSGNTSVRPFQIPGGPTGNARPVAHYRIATSGYFEAMGIPILAGRGITDADTADRPLVVVVNQRLKRAEWGDRDAVGQRITFGGAPDLWAEVVGVVSDVRHFGPGTPPEPEMYWPAAQVGVVASDTLRKLRRDLTLVVRSSGGDAAAIVPAVREAVRAVDPDQPIARVRTMRELMSASLWLSRASAWLLAVFGGAALAFALLGVFGAAAYGVVQRRRELAVRLALGAAPSTIERTVLRGALRNAIAGVIVGLVLAIALGRTVSNLLVGTDPADPRTLGAVCMALVVLATIASWLPARRAARIDPMQALREE